MQEVEKALKAAGIASTKVVTYGFFGWSIAYLGQINFPGQPAPTEVSVYGDGNTLGAHAFLRGCVSACGCVRVHACVAICMSTSHVLACMYRWQHCYVLAM